MTIYVAVTFFGAIGLFAAICWWFWRAARRDRLGNDVSTVAMPSASGKVAESS